MDAPIHFAKGAKAMDEIPLADLSGPLVLIDISKEAESSLDMVLNSGTLMHGKCSMVAFRLVPSSSLMLAGPNGEATRRYLSMQTPPGQCASLGCLLKLSIFLLAQRSINGVGTDALSPETI